MAKCVITLEDVPSGIEGAFAVNTVTDFEPELPVKDGMLEMDKATEAQKFAVVMLNAAKERSDETHEDFVVGRQGEGDPIERIDNPD